MFRSTFRAIVVLALSALLALLAALSANASTGGGTVTPNAGPHIYPAGCESGTAHNYWGGSSSFPVYEITVRISWCWTTGTASSSRIYNIRGQADSDSTTFWQDRNANAPTHADHTPIYAADRFGPQVDVYGWFQTRSCSTGPLSLVCTSWLWHRTHMQLWRGGGFGYVGQT